MNAETLLEQFDVMVEAPNGVQKLRELILQLAVRGKLVPQDAADESASVLVDRIVAERERLVREGRMNRPRSVPPATETNAPFLAPGTWRWIRLEDIADLRIGRTPSTKVAPYWCEANETGVPWVSISDMPETGFVGKTKRRVTKRAVAEVFKQPPAPAGTLLMSFKLSIGKLAFLSEPAYHNEAIVSIVPSVSEVTPFLQRCFRGLDLTAGTKGALMGDTLNRESLGLLSVPLPPLPEQRRIVTKVDELMALCDDLEARQQRRAEARARANRSVLHHLTAATDDEVAAHWQRLRENFGLLFGAPELVGELRLLFVDLAVRGKLLRGAADAALGPSRTEVQGGKTVSLPPIPTHWRWERIAALGADPANPVQTGPFGAQLHKSEFVESGVPVIAVGNLTGRGFTTEGLYYVTRDKAASLGRYDVKSGDVLFARSGATLGKVCVAPDFVDDWRMTGHILRARLNLRIANPHFVVYALWGSQVVRDQVMAGVQGTTRPGYNTGLLERILLPIPPRSEQDNIVARLDELMALCDRLESQLTHARDTATHLAASLVHHLTAA